MQNAIRKVRESYTVDYAGFWIRLLALLIDILILAALNWGINTVWGLVAGTGWTTSTADPLAEEALATTAYWGINFAIVFLLQLAYFIGFWGWRGQTPGKMIMRVKIVRFDDSRIGWGGAVMRYLGYIISVVPFLTGLLWVAFDARRQGFHDKIADTYVVSSYSK